MHSLSNATSNPPPQIHPLQECGSALFLLHCHESSQDELFQQEKSDIYTHIRTFVQSEIARLQTTGKYSVHQIIRPLRGIIYAYMCKESRHCLQREGTVYITVGQNLTALQKGREVLDLMLLDIEGLESDSIFELLQKTNSDTEAVLSDTKAALIESNEKRRKLSLQLQTAVGKFRENAARNIDEQARLKQTILDKDGEIFTLSNEKSRLGKALEEIQERAAKRLDILGKIDLKLSQNALSGNTGPERLESILQELESLRRQEHFWKDSARRAEDTKQINEALQAEIKALKKERAQILLESGHISSNEIIDTFCDHLTEYFGWKLREFHEPSLYLGEVTIAEEKVKEFFFVGMSRKIDMLSEGEKLIDKLVCLLKENGCKYNDHSFSITAIGGIGRHVKTFLQELAVGKAKKGIELYIANATRH